MLDHIKQLGSLLKGAQEIRQRAEQLRVELERRTVEGEAGGGAVRVVLNGRGRAVRVDIDQPLMAGIAGDDKTMVEELIAAAFNAAMEKVHEVVADELKKMAGGVDIPGLSGMLGPGGDV